MHKPDYATMLSAARLTSATRQDIGKHYVASNRKWSRKHEYRVALNCVHEMSRGQK